MSDWAPYQSTDPEAQRSTLRSPPPGSSLISPRYDNPANPWGDSRSYSPSNPIRPENDFAGSSSGGGGGSRGFGNSREFVNQFETSLPLRMDVEAALAYLIFPPASGVILLLLEHNSDYVRFHAWQSALVFTAMFVLHIIFIWSSFFSWLIFLADIGMMGYLALRAYRDADTLDRYEVPFFGTWANSFVDEE